MYIEVAVDQNFIGMDRPYTYSVPQDLEGKIYRGQRVLVPFGKKKKLGLVLRDQVEAKEEGFTIKAIEGIYEDQAFLPSDLMDLSQKMEEEYFLRPFTSLSYLLPPNKGEGIIYSQGKFQLEKPLPGKVAYLKGEGENSAQERVLKVLREEGPLTRTDLMAKAQVSRSPIDSLWKKGKIGPYQGEEGQVPDQKLTEDQERAKKSVEETDRLESLLFGVTGSGKTEVYLHWAREMIQEGRQVLILVPEIALTPQMVDRVKGRFGERTSVMHSKMSDRERKNQWCRIRNGEIDVVVGARSGIFAPLSRLGLIIIDEEQESSYGYQQSLRYDVRDLARVRADLAGAKLVYGSATPEVSLFHRAKEGEVNLVRLDQRVDEKPLPAIHLVDMRKELMEGNTSILSNLLYQKIDHCLRTGNQGILFLNRRGYSNFVSCRACGSVIMCDDCDIAMTYHKTIHRLRCHYCGATKALPKTCPVCGSPYMKPFGIGTQQVEEMIGEYFPQARIHRMDRDTTSKKEAYEEVYDKMKNKEIDLLIGTQMLAKGLDFPDVTLVGILAADTSLYVSDFKAQEQCFSLLTQVAGRSGRGESPGTVVLQTYSPENYAIDLATRGDYERFYEREVINRQAFLYPPFCSMVTLQCTGPKKEVLYQVTQNLYRDLVRQLKGLEILGSRIIEIPKIKNKYTYKFQLKSQTKDVNLLRRGINRVFKSYEEELKDIYIDIFFER